MHSCRLTTEQYLFSPEVRVLDSLLKLLEAYCAVERIFDAMSFTDVVTDLRKEHTASLDTVLSLCRSHVNIKSKNVLLLKVLQVFSFIGLRTENCYSL